ncbi:MAG: sulfite exporter TauE/SafE family protein [Acidimicrobiia bacterium]|nr:sulfite exporter TauE/SafE family protein [Acidimicrobiia bacterium]
MNPHLVILSTGLVVGVLYGMFGVGSALATPLLALAGVPGMVAVTAPLPAILPGSALGGWSHWRRGTVDRRLALWTLMGAVPASIAGAAASRHVSGTALVVASGAALLAVGIRVVLPDRANVARVRAARRDRAALVIPAAAACGFFAGLLANGGGFLLVPLFLLVFGLEVPEAAGTSLVAVTAITVPTLVAHSLLGGFDWTVTVLFGIGMLPGTIAGARLGDRLPLGRLRPAFGVLLLGLAALVLVRFI